MQSGKTPAKPYTSRRRKESPRNCPICRRGSMRVSGRFPPCYWMQTLTLERRAIWLFTHSSQCVGVSATIPTRWSTQDRTAHAACTQGGPLRRMILQRPTDYQGGKQHTGKCIQDHTQRVNHLELQAKQQKGLAEHELCEVLGPAQGQGALPHLSQ